MDGAGTLAALLGDGRADDSRSSGRRHRRGRLARPARRAAARAGPAGRTRVDDARAAPAEAVGELILGRRPSAPPSAGHHEHRARRAAATMITTPHDEQHRAARGGARRACQRRRPSPGALDAASVRRAAASAELTQAWTLARRATPRPRKGARRPAKRASPATTQPSRNVVRAVAHGQQGEPEHRDGVHDSSGPVESGTEVAPHRLGHRAVGRGAPGGAGCRSWPRVTVVTSPTTADPTWRRSTRSNAAPVGWCCTPTSSSDPCSPG